MSCMRMLDRNYTAVDLVANRYVSSEQTAFPISNIYDIYRRRKVWRSAGYFNIISGENTLVFREQVGVDITATIPVDEYATFALFAAAVKAALEDVGVATYTVTLETDKRIKILSNLGGGAAVFQLRFATSTAIADTLGYDAINLSGAASYVADDISLHTEEFIKWDMGIPLNPDSFVFASQRNELLKFSPTAVVTLQGAHTDNWAAPAYSQALTVGQNVIVQHQDGGIHTEPLRYWRLKIVDRRNPLGYVEGGLVFLGTSVDLDRGCVRFPLQVEAIDLSITTYSEAGNSYTDKRPQTDKIELEWNGLVSEDREALRDVFERFGTKEPFFLLGDPDAVFSSASSVWTRYVKYLAAPRESLVSPDNWSMNMSVREEL